MHASEEPTKDNSHAMSGGARHTGSLAGPRVPTQETHVGAARLRTTALHCEPHVCKRMLIAAPHVIQQKFNDMLTSKRQRNA
eukprot:365053-Chlamydomonas_euryale.AAC.10